MSGGVDSSVVAARVAESGLRAVAITLAMWPREREVVRDRGCCSIDAVEDARRVADQLGMRHYVWNLEDDFDHHVIRAFEDGYAAGRTPNPCTRCNERIKFGVLLDRARSIGATHLATGHYARVGRRGAAFTLHRARDGRRDQSYVLHRLSQHQLGHALFPLGASDSKDDVRAEAAARTLITAAKSESQDLCFVDGTLRDELGRRLAGRFAPGPVVDRDGATIGRHDGLPFLTVGQRSGLRIETRRPDAAPRYVIELRPVENVVVVGGRADLQKQELIADDCSWISGMPPAAGTMCQAQLRAHGSPEDARVEGVNCTTLRLRFPRPVEQVSPGQAVVLFNGDEVLGGGVIQRAT